MTTTRRLASTTLLIVVALLSNTPSAQLPQTIGGYIRISEVRVGRLIYEYVFRATLTNNGPALAGATAVASSNSAALTILEGSLTFGPVGPGETAVSLDTFTFRYDRAFPFGFGSVQWAIVATPADQAPVANAGPDQNVSGIGALVQLDGSASSDPDLDPLTYQWTLTDVPAGSAAILSSPTAVNPTFVPDRRGVYVAELMVHDGTAASAADSVVITVSNTIPVANAGPDQTVGLGAAAMLTGAASSDADGDPLTFFWQFQSRPAGSAAVLSNPSAVTPSFIVDVAGTYVVRLIVNDGIDGSLPDLVVISTDNSAPVANAGPNQTVALAQTVTLDGSASSDTDGDPLTFLWTMVGRPAGSSAVLSSPTAVRPTFVADRLGAYRIRLVVNDGQLSSEADVVEIDTQNTPPVAHAGPDQPTAVGATVTLDGSGSTDVDGNPLTFSWSLTSVPAGSAATISNPTAVMPTFVADVSGVYVAQLVVNDGIDSSQPDSVTIATQNSAPVANAGPDQSVVARQVVFLDGTASSDADGDALTFAWSITTRPAGSAAALIAPISPTPTFTADLPGTYIAQLIVSDGVSSSAADTVTISTTNATPVANAGPDQLNVAAGSLVGLDGSASADADAHPLTYFWAILSKPVGSAAVLSSPSAVASTFTADLVGDYVVQLVVNDGFVGSAPDTVLIRASGAALPTVTVNATDSGAAEAGGNTGTVTFTRNGDLSSALVVQFALGGSATNGADYALVSASITIPAGSDTAALVISPLADNLVEPLETVSVTILPDAAYQAGAPAVANLTISDNPAVIQVAATDPGASEVGLEQGVFEFTRTGGNLTAALQVLVTRTGSATAGVDYIDNGTVVTIPANQASALLTVTPIADGLAEGDETVIVTIATSAAYAIGASSTATVTIFDTPVQPTVSVAAVDAGASESGPDAGTFRFTRTGGTGSVLSVAFSLAGSATNGQDYAPIAGTVVIQAGQASADVTITPVADAVRELSETVIASVLDGASYDLGAPVSATVTIVDADGECTFEVGAMVNGLTHCGAISAAGEVDTWSFTATAGDRIAVSLGQVADNNDYRPWLRLIAPNTAVLGNTSGLNAAAIDSVIAPVTGVYQVLVASFDSGFDGTGTYRLTMAHSPGPITTAAGDHGGPLTNGGMHTGGIFAADLDVWTFTANAGERIAVHAGEVDDFDDFRPWLRLYAPNGDVLATTSGLDAAAIDGVLAPVAGTYLVLMASFDSGFDGAGTYRLTMTHTPGPITVSAGDQGGPLTNGAIDTGEIVQGDVDVWTFTATAGDRIALHAGEITDADDFRPWLRLYAPNGAVLSSTSGLDAAAIDGVAATVTGTYMVLVASFDSGFDGAGTYRMTLVRTPGPITVSPGDQGGPLTNGATHTGEIVQGDVDVWTFTVNAGDRIGLHAGEITDTDDFRPWLRLYAPNGAVLASASGLDATAVDGVLAPVAGTYLVLVASFDSGFDGTGTYRLTMVQAPGLITVSAGDQGGPLTNGAIDTGEIVQGDVDVWTFTATAGDRIALHAGEITDADDFRPWLRLYAPNGAVLSSTSGLDAAAIDGVAATVTGTYMVLVASFDSGFDGAGTYRMTLVRTPGPITVSPGDQGGPLTNGATHTGEIVQGDVDVWTFTVNAGDRIGLHAGEITDTDDFRPWLRLYAPNGAVLASASGLDATAVDGVLAPVAGTYLVLVASFDSGFDGTGTYRLTMTHTPGPITVSAGDQGGPLTNGAIHTGEIVQGDLDVWTISVVAGATINVQLSQTSETDDFRPWVRVWAPHGAVLASTSGLDTASVAAVVAPVTGTYLILVGSFDSGFDGTGTYSVRVTTP